MYNSPFLSGAFPVGQMIKSLPEVQETQVQSLGQEDPLDKGMATQSSILAWRIPWVKEPGGPTVHGVTELDPTEQLTLSLSTCQGERQRLPRVPGSELHSQAWTPLLRLPPAPPFVG